MTEQKRTVSRAVAAGLLVATITATALLTPDAGSRTQARCFGRHETHTGTSAADVIYGTDRNDTMRGRGGNDALFGLTGRDRLCGGSGDDTLTGGSGYDKINGGRGTDSCNGEVERNCEG